MLFLVELDYVKSGQPLTPVAGHTFIEQIILPTLARAEQLTKEEKIVAGGPVAGRIALQHLHGSHHLVLGVGQRLTAHAGVPPLIRVPTGSP